MGLHREAVVAISRLPYAVWPGKESNVPHISAGPNWPEINQPTWKIHSSFPVILNSLPRPDSTRSSSIQSWSESTFSHQWL